MFESNVFDAKIVNDEAEDAICGAKAPAWRQLHSRLQHKDAGLGKTVTALANFEVYPIVAVSTQEVVFQDEFVWDI